MWACNPQALTTQSAVPSFCWSRYDYKFHNPVLDRNAANPLELAAKMGVELVLCSCGSKKCRKYL